jgi:oxaloacetate decarboxylase alpha subunit
VVKILVKPGDSVAAGQQVLMLEAMKMETAVSASGAGTVTEIAVKVGDQVAVGDTLLAIA